MKLKWIGQYIWDKISRFRDDVYLEGISTSTETDMLVIDSNNKVSKRAIDAITVDVSDFMTNGVNNRVLTATGADAMNAEANLEFNGTTLDITGSLTTSGTQNFNGESTFFESSAANKPYIEIENTNSGVTGSNIWIKKDKGAAGADGDVINSIYYWADNSAQEQTLFGSIISQVVTAADTDEAGKISIKVASSDGSTSGLQQALTATGHGTGNYVDASIGYGTSSTTTIAGTLTMGSTAALTNAGLVVVANQSSITGLGTITSGTWTGTAIAAAYIADNKGGRHFGDTLKILPQDFMKNDDSSGNALNYKDAATAGVQIDNTSLEAIAFVAIPEGMKATHVDMYGTADSAVVVHEESISSNVAWAGGSAATDLAGGSGEMNTQITLSSAVESSATNMLAIKVTLTATSQRIWGGLVTIAAI